MRITHRSVASLASLTLLFLGLLYSVSSIADMEGRMPLSRISLDSLGISGSGPVHVELTQSDKGVTKLKIGAFGSTQSLSSSQLAALGERQFNGISLSESPGYGGSFGHGIYLILSQGFSSEIQIIATVSIYERADIRVNIGKPAQLP